MQYSTINYRYRSVSRRDVTVEDTIRHAINNFESKHGNDYDIINLRCTEKDDTPGYEVQIRATNK